MPQIYSDVNHVETPLNPAREANNLDHCADKAHKTMAFLTADATFRPPPVHDPFNLGPTATVLFSPLL
ncbi:hypothetical protein V8C42DRAFT_323586 [Trichoderma barbatum]